MILLSGVTCPEGSAHLLFKDLLQMLCVSKSYAPHYHSSISAQIKSTLCRLHQATMLIKAICGLFTKVVAARGNHHEN